MKNFFKADIRFEILIRLVRWVYPKYRLMWPYVDWWQDEWFNEYLDRFNERDGMNTHRRWEMYQLKMLTETVSGDTAECGVFLGAGSYLICSSNKQQQLPRRHHIFDSFEGLSEPSQLDGEHWSMGDLSAQAELVEQSLGEFDTVSLYPGWIPDRFDDVATLQFSYVHIDVDLYQPTKDSIEFFYSRLSPGAVLICDDYGCTTCPGATRAIDEFLAAKPEQFISLSAGGGFLIKCHPARE